MTIANVKRALVMRDYFMEHFKTLFAEGIETSLTHRRDRLRVKVEALKNAGTPITRRELARSLAPYRDRTDGPTLVERDLLALGYRVITPRKSNARRGRPTEEWGLSTAQPAKADDAPADEGHSPESARRIVTLIGPSPSSAASDASKAGGPEYRHKSSRDFESRADLERVFEVTNAHVGQRWQKTLEDLGSKRDQCPICQSSDGFTWNAELQKWSCFSTKHSPSEMNPKSNCTSGDFIDLELGSELGRKPTSAERVEFVKKHNYQVEGFVA